LENSGANGASACIIVIGRVRILRSPLLAETGDESVPYPFRSQMAKVHSLLKFAPLPRPRVDVGRG
jgi:hypothetical protein